MSEERFSLKNITAENNTVLSSCSSRQATVETVADSSPPKGAEGRLTFGPRWWTDLRRKDFLSN